MSTAPTLHYHKGDLPPGLSFPNGIAVDTETMGLKPLRDRLCVVQVSAGDGSAHVVQILPGVDSPELKRHLSDPETPKIMHFGRFDIAALYHGLDIVAAPVFCTKIASRLCRTNTDAHSLKALCRDLLKVDLSKQQQTSDWGAEELTPEQVQYAASDVLYLHALREKLVYLLEREGRSDFADACFDFLPVRACLDLAGFEDVDIFSH